MWHPYTVNNEQTFPLPQYKNERVIGTFLVTVELINKDKQDDPEVTEAIWDCMDNTWKYICDPSQQYGDHGWIVTAWKDLPDAYITN